MTNFRVPGITSIEVVNCLHLAPNLMLHSISGETVEIGAPTKKISFIGRPVLSWDGDVVNGVQYEKSTLQFLTLETLPINLHLAFVVTCADGSRYLIGAHEPNYPVIRYSETTGEPGKSAAVREYKITHTAPKSVLRCVL